MNLPSRMLADDLVHEIEKLAPASSRIVAGLNLAGGYIQSRKQSGRSMPLVIMTESTQRPTSRKPQVSLSSFQRLDVRFLIHRQEQGVVGRMQIKPHNVSRLGSKLGIGAHTPAAPPLQLNVPAPQHPPHVGSGNVSQDLSQQGTIPNGITRGWGPIQLLQDATFHLGIIESRWACSGPILQPRQSLARKTQPPFADGSGSLSQLLGNRLSGTPLGCCQNDSGSQLHPLFGFARSHPLLQSLTIVFAQSNRCHR